MKISEKEPMHLDGWSRNNPHPSRICHIPGLSQAQAVCSTIDHRLYPKSVIEDPIRHTPQTKSVTLMKGLNDVPVCTVLQTLSELEKFLNDKCEVKSANNESSLGSKHKEVKKKQRIGFLDNLWKRSHSCPDGIRVDEIGDFKLELVRRHNPHARRVCHIKGLNDVPVCVVRDELNTEWENRFIVSPGSLAPAQSKPKKKPLSDKNGDYGYLTDTQHTDNSTKDTAAVLEDRDVVSNSNADFNAPSKILPECPRTPTNVVRPISPIPFERTKLDRSSRTSSRVSVPKMTLIPTETYENDLNDELDSIQALDILCSILQTNSLQTVQAWIEQATDEERTVVLKALRDMKQKGLLAKPSGVYMNNLPAVQEDKVSVSYEKKWNQNKSLEDSGEADIPEPPPVEEARPPPVVKTPTVGTQTPVSVLSNGKRTATAAERPPTRIQMTGLSRPASIKPSSPGGRPSTMKSVREKFMSGRNSETPAKDPGFTWTVKHRDNPTPDLLTKA